MSSDFKALLKVFNDNQVNYLIVGGYAVMKHSEPRFTKDLDLWIEASEQNAARAFDALREFGAPLNGLTPDDFAHEGFFYQMGRPPARVDIFMSIEGVSFRDAWANRVVGNFDGTPATFISRPDLIIAKKAAGRPQDLIDVDALSLAEKLQGA
jgi:hypothetical protein